MPDINMSTVVIFIAIIIFVPTHATHTPFQIKKSISMDFSIIPFFTAISFNTHEKNTIMSVHNYTGYKPVMIITG